MSHTKNMLYICKVWGKRLRGVIKETDRIFDMLRKIRISVAIFMWACCALLFLDFTGSVHTYLGWVARVQFFPALLAMNVFVVLFLLALTLVFGRVYCSAICPLGITYDIMARFGKKAKKNRYSYSKALTWLRLTMLLVFAACFAFGIASVVALLEPYSFFGRIMSNLFAPIYALVNNFLAWIAEKADSYAFYTVDVWIKGLGTFVLTSVCFTAFAVLAWRNGRTYCNTVCPVGTLLGFLSKYSLFRPVVDSSKCTKCRKCERNCKAACINIKGGTTIDYSRCVACMDCLDNCKYGAMSYTWRFKKQPAAPVAAKPEKNRRQEISAVPDDSRRKFLSLAALAAGTAVAEVLPKSVDGGLAVIEDKVKPSRGTRVVPPGARGLSNFSQHCTACQLCVSVCPNGVLRPGSGMENFMQPEMGFERGYCRPECVKCSEVCPTSAITKITVDEKTSVQIGHAVWVAANCVPLTDGVECGNCARHCPSEAIQMVPSDSRNPGSLKIPVINDAKCIGCGACEYLCPARPFGAIYVEGYERHLSR